MVPTGGTEMLLQPLQVLHSLAASPAPSSTVLGQSTASDIPSGHETLGSGLRSHLPRNILQPLIFQNLASSPATEPAFLFWIWIPYFRNLLPSWGGFAGLTSLGPTDSSIDNTPVSTHGTRDTRHGCWDPRSSSLCILYILYQRPPVLPVPW